jgi:hypothetical protein
VWYFRVRVRLLFRVWLIFLFWSIPYQAESIRKVDKEALEKRQKVCNRQDYVAYSNFFVAVLGNELAKTILDECIQVQQNASLSADRKKQDLATNLNLWKKELVDKVRLPNPFVLSSVLNSSKSSSEILNIIRDYIRFRVESLNGIKLEPQPYEFSVYIIYLRNHYLQEEFTKLLEDVNDPLLSSMEIENKIQLFRTKLQETEDGYKKISLSAGYLPKELTGVKPSKQWFSTVFSQLEHNPYLKNNYKSNLRKLKSCLNGKSSSALNQYAGFFQDYDIPYTFPQTKDKSLDSYLKLFFNAYFDDRIFGKRLDYMNKICK